MYRLLLLVLLTEQVGYLSAPAWRYLLGDKADGDDADGEKKSDPARTSDAETRTERRRSMLAGVMAAPMCRDLVTVARKIYHERESVIPNVENRPIIVIGDIHGAYNELLEIFQANGMVNGAGDFIGKDHIIVIMGNLIYRGPNSEKCVEKVFEWQEKAPDFGSNIIFLFGPAELEQMLYEFGEIELGGVESYDASSPYFVPKEQIPYLKRTDTLDRIRDKSLFMFQIGDHLFTLSGFDVSSMDELFKLTEKEKPESAHDLIIALNDIVIDGLKRCNNEYFDKILREEVPASSIEAREIFTRSHKTEHNTKLVALYEALNHRIQREAKNEQLKEYLKDIDIFNTIMKTVNSQIVSKITAREQITPILHGFVVPLLKKFGAKTLWVGHFYEQMQKVLFEPTVQFEDAYRLIFSDDGMWEKKQTPKWCIIKDDISLREIPNGVHPLLIADAQRIYDDKVSFIPNDGVDVKKRRVIIIGDPHGAYDELKSIFLRNKLIDIHDHDRWIGEKVIVGIMGDLLHRGPKSQKLVEHVLSWQEQAPAFGSTIILLYGNHEISQMHHKWGYIEIFGYNDDIRGYTLPNQDQIDYFENEETLRKLKERGQFIVQIGDSVYTHSGYDAGSLKEFIKITGLDNPTLQELNNKFRAELMNFNNAVLDTIAKKHEIPNDTIDLFRRLGGLGGKKASRRFSALLSLMQEKMEGGTKNDVLQQDINQMLIFQHLLDSVNGRWIKHVYPQSEKSGILCKLVTDFLRFVSDLTPDDIIRPNRLFVGHYFGQKDHTLLDLPPPHDFFVYLEQSCSHPLFLTDRGMGRRGRPSYYEVKVDGETRLRERIKVVR